MEVIDLSKKTDNFSLYLPEKNDSASAYTAGFYNNFVAIDKNLNYLSSVRNITEPNLITKSGNYVTYRNAVNSIDPGGEDGKLFITVVTDEYNNQLQQAYDMSNKRNWSRRRLDEVWTEWKQNPTGISNEQVIFGDLGNGKSTILSNINVSSIMDSGFYSTDNTCLGLPMSINPIGSFIAIHGGNNVMMYLYKPSTSNELFMTQCIGGAIGSWKTISETKEDVYAYFLTVDGHGSGLDADFVDGMHAVPTATNLTVVSRDASGNFAAKVITVTGITNTGNETIAGTIGVAGNASFAATLNANGGTITSTATSFNLLTGVQTINFANAATALTIGTTTANSTTNLQVGATISGATKNVNIATNALAGATTNVNIGSATGTSNIKLDGDTLNTGMMTVKDATSLESSLDVTGATSLDSTLSVAGASEFTGQIRAIGGINTETLVVAGNAVINGGLNMDGSVVITEDLAVNGGDITSTSATFNLLNQPTTATAFNSAETLSIANSAIASGKTKAITIGANGVAGSTTAIHLGSTTGASSVAVKGSLSNTGTLTSTGLITGSNGLTTTSGVFSSTLGVTGATTLSGLTNNGNATITGNGTIGGDLAIDGGDLTSSASVFALLNQTSAITAFTSATALTIANSSSSQTINFGTGSTVGGGTKTISIGTSGLAASTTLITLGSSTGTSSIQLQGNQSTSGTLVVTGNTTLSSDLAVNGGDITTTSATATVFNDTATTVSAFGSATNLTVGGATTTSTLNIGTGATASGSTKTVNIGTDSLGGATTVVNIGSSSGTSNINVKGNESIVGSLGVSGLLTASSGINTTTINSSGDATIGGNIIVTGNVTINGTTTTINAQTMTIDDPLLTLGGDTAPAINDALDKGVEFRWHNGSTAKLGFFGFDNSTGKFTFIPDATNVGNIMNGTAGTIVATLFEGELLGNATTATTLQNGRGLTVGNTSKTFNGSANLSWSLTEIGAAATAQNMYIGTTLIPINRASANLALTGILSTSYNGSTSGTTLLKPSAVAGTTTITLPAITGTIITTGDSATVTNTMLAGSIANAKLANSSITIGTTALSLGSSSTSLAGLVVVSSADYVGTTITLTGNASFDGTLTADGSAILGSTLEVTGATSLSSTLGVAGNTTLTGDLAVNGGGLTSSATTFNLLNQLTTVNAFSAATTLNVGASTATAGFNFANGATISGATKTIRLGNNGVAGSTTNTYIGSLTGTSTITLQGNSSTSGAHTANGLGVSNTSNTSLIGISLYGGSTVNPSYGLMFAGTPTAGTHGFVTGDWATYLTMSLDTGRGWIFKSDTGVASISNTGYATFNGSVTSAGLVNSGSLTQSGAASLGGALSVAGTSTFTGRITANGGVTGALIGNASTSTTLATSKTIGILTGDIISDGSSFDGSTSNTNTTTIAANAVTNDKSAKMATLTLKGNATGATANPQDLTVTQIDSMIGITAKAIKYALVFG
jgi:hypothetical protein